MPDALGQLDRHLAWARLWNDGTDEAIEQWVDAFYGTKDSWVSDLKRVLREEGQPAFWKKSLAALRTRHYWVGQIVNVQIESALSAALSESPETPYRQFCFGQRHL